jgi:hypothetical protein
MGHEPKDKVVEALVSFKWAVLANAIVFLSVFLFQFLCFSPKHLWEQANRKAIAAESHQQELQARLVDVGQQRAAEKFKHEQEIAEFQGQLDNRTERRKMAIRIAEAMEQGRLLVQKCRNGAIPTEEETKAWVHGTVNPILRELGLMYIARFNSATEEGISSASVPTHAVIEFCWFTARLRMLEQFIKELTPVE